MIAFTSAIEPLRIANRLSGRRLYDWRLVSRDGAPVAASNGIAIQVDAAIAAHEPPGAGVLPAVVLCGGLGSEHYQNKEVFAWLRRWDRRGAQIGALCTGAHVLARAGLLDRHRCTIHWENLPGFIEAFPEIPVTLRPLRDRPQPLHLLGRHGGARPDAAPDRRWRMATSSRPRSPSSASSTASAARTTASACRCGCAWACTTPS